MTTTVVKIKNDQLNRRGITVKINQKQFDAVTALPADKRYKSFIKTIADTEEVWALWQDGWALATDDITGQSVFPFWPAEEYAKACAINEWNGYEPSLLPLDEFMNELLPKLKEDNVLPGIFFTSEGKGPTPTIDQLLDDINLELENY
jgi:Protein of unknown function (DUF2750)